MFVIKNSQSGWFLIFFIFFRIFVAFIKIFCYSDRLFYSMLILMHVLYRYITLKYFLLFCFLIEKIIYQKLKKLIKYHEKSKAM